MEARNIRNELPRAFGPSVLRTSFNFSIMSSNSLFYVVSHSHICHRFVSDIARTQHIHVPSLVLIFPDFHNLLRCVRIIMVLFIFYSLELLGVYFILVIIAVNNLNFWGRLSVALFYYPSLIEILFNFLFILFFLSISKQSSILLKRTVPLIMTFLTTLVARSP